MPSVFPWFRFRRRLLLGLVPLVVVTQGCAVSRTKVPPPSPFALEQDAGQSFVFSQPLPAGTRVSFVSLDIKPMELLILQRCGQGCSTAKVVGEWRKADFDRLSERTVALSEPGEYYFWIKRELENGEVGPLLGQAATVDGMNGIARFVSGTTVFVAVRLP